MWACGDPSVQLVTLATGCPAATVMPSVTDWGSTWRKTHTCPSALWILTVPPKIWPLVASDSRTSTIVPAIGERTGAPPRANRS
jgi:hypothetical protein